MANIAKMSRRSKLKVILEFKTSDASYVLRQIHTAGPCYGAVKSNALCRSVERV